MNAPDLAAKIAALLRKAEDPAATPAEAEAYSEKAERLMVKWGVSEAVARQAAGEDVPREKIIERRVRLEGTYHRGEYEIGEQVARGLGCRVLISKQQHRTTLYVIGHESDVERFDVLFASLRLQAASALAAWTKDERLGMRWQWMSHHEKFKARRQFLMSFAWVVGSRLRRMRQETVAEPEYHGGAEVALRDRSAQVEDWVSAQYPKLRKARGDIESHWYGGEAGRAAGSRANLGSTSLPGSRKQVGS